MKTITFEGTSMTNEDRYKAAKRRVTEVQNTKIGLQKERELLSQRYKELVKQAEALGVTDVGELPDRISAVESELSTKLSQMELKLTEVVKALHT